MKKPVVRKSETGNTKPSLDEKRVRRWTFTLNNYLENDRKELAEHFNKVGAHYIMGYEVGKLNGTNHIQGYVEFKNPIGLSAMKKINGRMNLQHSKGNAKQNIDYCSKESEDILSNFKDMNNVRDTILQKIYSNVIWKKWQQYLIDVCDRGDNDRKVYWFYDITGNTGKSFLAKYLFCKYNCCIGTGKKNDVFNQVLTYIKENECDPELIICDIPREDYDFFNYGALEQLKNGLCYSGKYEGGVVLLEKLPIIICFANTTPKMDAFSQDRWVIRDIENNFYNDE